jgi:hypothetical protein
LRCEQRVTAEIIGHIGALILEIQLDCGGSTVVENNIPFPVTGGIVISISILESGTLLWSISQSKFVAGWIEVLAVEGVNATDPEAAVPQKFHQSVHERTAALLLKT